MNKVFEQVTIAVFVLGALALIGLRQDQEPGKIVINEVAAIEESQPGQTWRVKPGSVYDGDTFRVLGDGGEELKIRMACIDAPELAQDGGKESRDFLRGMLLDNREVILTIADTDRYGRTVAEVFAKTDNPEVEVAVNGEMIAAGQAHFYGQYKSGCPDNAEQYEHLEELAKGGNLGLWASGNVVEPGDYRKRNK